VKKVIHILISAKVLKIKQLTKAPRAYHLGMTRNVGGLRIMPKRDAFFGLRAVSRRGYQGGGAVTRGCRGVGRCPSDTARRFLKNRQGGYAYTACHLGLV
jgi:hypothetical protein